MFVMLERPNPGASFRAADCRLSTYPRSCLRFASLDATVHSLSRSAADGQCCDCANLTDSARGRHRDLPHDKRNRKHIPSSPRRSPMIPVLVVPPLRPLTPVDRAMTCAAYFDRLRVCIPEFQAAHNSQGLERNDLGVTHWSSIHEALAS